MCVCEIGIGDGHLLRLLANANLIVTGIDVSSYLIRQLGLIFADEKININLLEQDISEPISVENAFDVVFCLDVLEHVDEIKEAILNIKNILKNQGILVATLPWKENLDKGMVICPKCNYEFHRVGHFHSFQCYDDIIRMLGDNYHILDFNYVKPMGYKNKIIDLLKRVVFRRKFYKGGVPNFHTTSLFVVQLNK